MIEVECRQAVRNLIAANKNNLVAGIIHHGVQREIVHNTVSMVTPPTGYYFIATTVTTINEYGNPLSINSIDSPRFGDYAVVITVIDYLYGVIGEDELYETMDISHQLITDRIVNLVASSEVIVGPSGERFRLKTARGNEKAVIKTNRDTAYIEAEQYHAVKYAEITFTVTNCVV